MSETITHRLLQRLGSEPDAVACRLVGPAGCAGSLSVRALMDRSLAYAAALPRAEGGRKLIGVCHDHGVELLASFLGAVLAGHIPTMMPPPSPRMDAVKYARNFRHMVDHISPEIVFTGARVIERLQEPLPDHRLGKTRLVLPDEVPFSTGFVPVVGKPNEVAVVQHSSGTTGQQKGVELSHQAVLDHNRYYRQRIELHKDDVIVSWLPLYHDMGFVACFLMPLLEGVPFVQMSPFDWVSRPVMLLEVIHEAGGTLCWMPNFAFSFMADSVRASQLREELDVSKMRAWINCSEPVYQASMQRFVEKFGGIGVRDEQLSVSYAMAENVFAVTQTEPGAMRVISVNSRLLREGLVEIVDDEKGATLYVSNGKPVKGTEVRIVDGDGAALGERRVGEIQVKGETLFLGYFRREDLTEKAFSEDGWYHTGDLGFFHEEELFLTGRKKDVIIIQGRNFYPSDLEEAVGDIDGIIRGRVVAVGLSDERSGTDQLVILCECKEGSEGEVGRLSLTVRQMVAQEFDCTPADVKIFAERWLVKSTSGKLARGENRVKYLAEKAQLRKQ